MGEVAWGHSQQYGCFRQVTGVLLYFIIAEIRQVLLSLYLLFAVEGSVATTSTEVETTGMVATDVEEGSMASAGPGTTPEASAPPESVTTGDNLTFGTEIVEGVQQGKKEVTCHCFIEGGRGGVKIVWKCIRNFTYAFMLLSRTTELLSVADFGFNLAACNSIGCFCMSCSGQPVIV